MKKKLHKLLEDTPEAYYWMGFIMADGTFVGNRLKVGLSIKDGDLLKKLHSFLGYDNPIHEYDIKLNNKLYKTCVFQVMDTHSTPLLKTKFDIKPRKTYNPPKTLKWMEDDLLYSFIIGFIDGDGSITKQYNREDPLLRIKVHSNWLHILDEISYALSTDADVKVVKAKINSQGYANINLANHILLKRLKLRVIELKLPVLDRKWSLIDENYINKNEISEYRIKHVTAMMEAGFSNKRIREVLGLKKSALSNLQKRNGLR